MSSYLLASVNTGITDRLHAALIHEGLKIDLAATGKEAQGLLFEKKYTAIVLDLELTDYSAFEVLKYIKLSKLATKVFLYIRDKAVAEEICFDEKKANRLGIQEVIYSPINPLHVIKSLKQLTHATSWKELTPLQPSLEDKEVRILDRELTHISISEVLQLNIAIFDHYLKLAPNKYVKVVKRGEVFPLANIKKYAEAGSEYLYFLTQDRIIFINYMNDLTQKMLRRQNLAGGEIVKALKSITEKLIEESYTQGISHNTVEEGKRVCQNMYDFVSKDRHLSENLSQLQEVDPTVYTKSFLVSFYSIVICKNVPWIGPRALDIISLGSLFHDIGHLKTPAHIRESRGKQLNAKDRAIYNQHPIIGAQMLSSSRLINEQVRQIVYQHHELMNGTGYPNNLTGLKIYPLAKIVSLADSFTDMVLEHKTSPRRTLKFLLQDREKVVKFDANILRALVHGLT